MKIVIAMDSFKGSLTSNEAGLAVRDGILRADPGADVAVMPLADGGEGTVKALVNGMGGRMRRITVTGPLGEPVKCKYGIVGDLAVMEIAEAAGLSLVPEKRRNPMCTTTFGVGEMIRDAIGKGIRKFLIGLGGSATNDGGMGMLQALGYGFLDRSGLLLPYGSAGLGLVTKITDDNVIPELSECSFRVACDVKNVLCGENGCSAVFAPQKGAIPELIPYMDRVLADYAAVAQRQYPKADPLQPGTGAAGGLGFAFLGFTNAVLEPGIEIVMEEIGLEEKIREADVVVTGEGRLDGQTVMGKAPVGVAKLAKKYHKPVIAFAGAVTEEARECNDCGIDAFFPVLRQVVTEKEAMNRKKAQANLTATAEQVFRLWKTAQR